MSSDSHSRRRNKKKKKEIDQLRLEEYEDERRNLLGGVGGDVNLPDPDVGDDEWDTQENQAQSMSMPSYKPFFGFGSGSPAGDEDTADQGGNEEENDENSAQQSNNPWSNFLFFSGGQQQPISKPEDIDDLFANAQNVHDPEDSMTSPTKDYGEPEDFIQVSHPIFQTQKEKEKIKEKNSPKPSKQAQKQQQQQPEPPKASSRKGKNRNKTPEPPKPPKVSKEHQNFEEDDFNEEYEGGGGGSLWHKIIFFLLLLLLGGLATIVLVNNNDTIQSNKANIQVHDEDLNNNNNEESMFDHNHEHEGPSDGDGDEHHGVPESLLDENGDSFLVNLLGLKDFLVAQYETIWPSTNDGDEQEQPGQAHDGTQNDEAEEHQENVEPDGVQEPIYEKVHAFETGEGYEENDVDIPPNEEPQEPQSVPDPESTWDWTQHEEYHQVPADSDSEGHNWEPAEAEPEQEIESQIEPPPTMNDYYEYHRSEPDQMEPEPEPKVEEVAEHVEIEKDIWGGNDAQNTPVVEEVENDNHNHPYVEENTETENHGGGGGDDDDGGFQWNWNFDDVEEEHEGEEGHDHENIWKSRPVADEEHGHYGEEEL